MESIALAISPSNGNESLPGCPANARSARNAEHIRFITSNFDGVLYSKHWRFRKTTNKNSRKLGRSKWAPEESPPID